MKIVLDNIIYSNVKQGGVSNYWFELSKYLLKKKENVFFYESNYLNYNFHRAQLEIPNNRIILDENFSKFSILNKTALVKIDDSERFLFHSSYYRKLESNKNSVQVTTVHDFTHNYYSPIHKKLAHNFIKYDNIKKSNGIICISNNTYNDLLKFCPPKKNQKIVVINNGVSNEFSVIKTLNSKDNFNFSIEKNSYILFVGSRENYKNFNFTIELLKANNKFNLIVVGTKFNANELKNIGSSINRVFIVSNVTNQELNILYNNALAFIYPSSYEGFGLPILESMKAGCPVIALNASSIPEVAGNAAILLKELDVSFANKIINNLLTREYRNEFIEKGLIQSSKFSWEKCTKETLDFYNEIY